MAPILTTIPTPQQNAIIDHRLNMSENEGKTVHMLMRPSQKLGDPTNFSSKSIGRGYI